MTNSVRFGRSALCILNCAFAGRRPWSLAILFAATFAARPAYACPVCFGASDSPIAGGVNMAILALMGVTGAVLAGFGAFFIYLMRRARLATADPGSEGSGLRAASDTAGMF